jgi:hypothetical protein
MCTYTITVDDKALKRLRPAFTQESFGVWLQQHVDNLVEDITSDAPHSESPIAHTAEEMKAIVVERLRRMESGEATYIDGSAGFEQIRAKYGL